jgi:hypothetical protein
MIRRGVAVVALALLAGPARGDGPTLRVPSGTAEVALSAMPRAVLNFLKSVAPATPREDRCPVPACAPGDQDCRQGAFHALVACLQEGRATLTDCPDCRLPAPSVTLFRTSGGGVTLYGSFGPGPRGDKRLLSALSRAVESPPPFQITPAEGGAR